LKAGGKYYTKGWLEARGDATVYEDVYWTALRSIKHTRPILMNGLCMISMRVKANGQTENVLEQVNCIAEAMLPVWDGDEWSEPQVTRNCAWAYADMLLGAANKLALTDAQIDLAGLLEWAGECSAGSRKFDIVFDSESTLYDRLTLCASVGRGRYGKKDCKYSVVRDIPQTVPLQHFTPRNSWGFKGSKAFLDRPHALKMKFVNSDAGWQPDERIVYDDGYNSGNATKFETIETRGITDSRQVWRAGRYHMAVAQLRPESVEINCDVEHLVCTRGDLVRVSHDVMLIGLGSGRVRRTIGASLSLNGSSQYAPVNVAAFDPDEGTWEAWVKAPFASYTTYKFRLFCADHSAGQNSEFRTTCVNNTAFKFYLYNGSSGVAVNFGALPDETWIHLAASWEYRAGTNDTLITAVLNGVQVDQQSLSGHVVAPDTAMHIGHYPGGQYYEGLVSDFRLWNKVRTPAEILAAKDAPLTGSESGLVAYWTLGDGEGTLAADLTGNGYDSSLVGAPDWVRGYLDAVTGAAVAGVVLDEILTMEADKSYCLRIRGADGTSIFKTVETEDGETSELAFSTLITDSQPLPLPGDLAMFGESGLESAEYLVKGIRPSRDLTAALTLVDAAPAVHYADKGEIPDYNSHITVPPMLNRPAPSTPVITNIRSDESALLRGTDGTLQSRILIALHAQSGNSTPAAHLQVQYRLKNANSPETWVSMPYYPADASEVAVGPVEDKEIYEIRVRAISALGVCSDWRQITHTVIGKTTRPPDIETLVREGMMLRWLYEPPLDIAGYLIRHQAGTDTTWSTGIDPLLGGLVTDPSFDLNRIPGGTRTVMAKAVDTSGNESLSAAAVTINLGEPVLANVLETQDEQAGGWTGTKLNCTVSGSDLVADDTGGAFFTDDEAPFFTDDADPVFTDVFAEMSYTTMYEVPAGCDGATLTVDLDVTGSWKLEYQANAGEDEFTPFFTDDDDPFFTDDADPVFYEDLVDFLPWPGAATVEAGQTLRFRLTVAGGSTQQGTVSGFVINVDVQDITEHFEDVSIAAPGGTRLPITESYRAIKIVSLTLQDDAGTAVTAKIIDKDEALGPLIKAYDAGGSATTALIDATIQGY